MATAHIRRLFIVILCLCHGGILLEAQSDSIAGNRLPLKPGDNVFTRGLFMDKGRFEIKMFNNLYTETAPYNGLFDQRGSYLTSFLQLTVGSHRNINYGLDLLYQSKVSGDLASGSPFRVLAFEKSEATMTWQGKEFTTTADHGVSHVGVRVRSKPLKNKRFTVQQALYVPVGSIDGGWVINSDLFFEYLDARKKYMLFGDLGLWYNTRQSPFPYLKIFGGTLITKRLGPYIMLNLPYEIGPGLKLFILPKVQLELLYTWWLPLEWTVHDKRPQTFNLGINFTNFNNFYKK